MPTVIPISLSTSQPAQPMAAASQEVVASDSPSFAQTLTNAVNSGQSTPAGKEPPPVPPDLSPPPVTKTASSAEAANLGPNAQSQKPDLHSTSNLQKLSVAQSPTAAVVATPGVVLPAPTPASQKVKSAASVPTSKASSPASATTPGAPAPQVSNQQAVTAVVAAPQTLSNTPPIPSTPTSASSTTTAEESTASVTGSVTSSLPVVEPTPQASSNAQEEVAGALANTQADPILSKLLQTQSQAASGGGALQFSGPQKGSGFDPLPGNGPQAGSGFDPIPDNGPHAGSGFDPIPDNGPHPGSGFDPLISGSGNGGQDRILSVSSSQTGQDAKASGLSTLAATTHQVSQPGAGQNPDIKLPAESATSTAPQQATQSPTNQVANATVASQITNVAPQVVVATVAQPGQTQAKASDQKSDQAVGVKSSESANNPDQIAVQSAGSGSKGTKDSTNGDTANSGNGSNPNGAGKPDETPALDSQSGVKAAIQTAVGAGHLGHASSSVNATPATNISAAGQATLDSATRLSAVKQVANQLQVMAATRPQNAVTIQLAPEGLGTVALTVKGIGKAISAELFASNDSVKAALSEGRNTLAEAMQQKGYTVTELTIRTHVAASQSANSSGDQGRPSSQQQSNQPSTQQSTGQSLGQGSQNASRQDGNNRTSGAVTFTQAETSRSSDTASRTSGSENLDLSI